jgi:hypothetical protein
VRFYLYGVFKGETHPLETDPRRKLNPLQKFAYLILLNSGRVGRTSAGRALEPEALTAAVVAVIRHNHTCYDQLLMRGWNRNDARDTVRNAVERTIESWRLPPGRRKSATTKPAN